MKRLFFLCCLCVTALTMQAEGFRYLTYIGSDLEQSFALNTLKTVTFTDTDVVFHHTDGSQVSLPLNGLSQLNFTQEATEIKNVDANVDVDVAVIYSSDGKVVGHQRLNSIKDANLSSLPHGIYIIKKGNETIKLMR